MSDCCTDMEEPVLAFLRVWQDAAARRGGLPTREDVDALKLPVDLLPSVFIYGRRSDDDRDDFLCRLCGTRLVSVFGFDPTGQSYRNSIKPEVYESRVAHFRRCVTDRVPIYYRATLGIDQRDFVAFSRLLLPVRVDESYGSADLIFGIMIFLRPETLQSSELARARKRDGVLVSCVRTGDGWREIW